MDNGAVGWTAVFENAVLLWGDALDRDVGEASFS